MTRFARAKGSKSSNERVPEEPTPWHVMKQQLEQSTLPVKQPKQKIKSARELLKEKEDSLYYPDPKNSNTGWAEFEVDAKKSKKNKINSQNDPPKKKIKNQDFDSKENDSVKKFDHNSHNSKVVSNDNNVRMKNKKKKAQKSDEKMPQSEKINNDNKSIKKSETSQDSSDKSFVKLSKRQKRNKKNKMKSNNDAESETNEKGNENNDNTSSGMFNIEGNDWNTNLKFGKNIKPQKQAEEKDETKNSPENESFNKNEPNNLRPNNFRLNKNGFNNNKFNNSTTKIVKKRKPPKIRDDQEHKRRKPDPGATKVIINGMEIEIVLYDGFPVKKDDAERLKELREKMVMKGIPKTEINAAMKLERRKAEKALARIRKNVCFHCRKAGHNLSDCPELGREEVATGICFKCGSTEHTHFECKVKKKEEFGFAKCFICREQGHIAKQCPDNPKGLYPQGGACKICGDVTHLKKDCPDLMKEKEENILTLDTIGESAVESLNKSEEPEKSEKISKLKNKVVKF